MNRPYSVSGVVLAGGASRRMGSDKALLSIDGQPLIARVANRLRTVVDEVIIAANDRERYGAYGDRCVPDVYRRVGTLAGIHAGLQAAAHDLALVVGCDMPFLDPAVLAWFAETAMASDADLVVLRHGDFVEPLHAVYRKSCLPAIEATIQSGERCAYAYWDQIRVQYVSPNEIVSLDPNLDSFRNVNTPGQWSQAVLSRCAEL